MSLRRGRRPIVGGKRLPARTIRPGRTSCETPEQPTLQDVGRLQVTATHHATLLHLRLMGELDVAGVGQVEQTLAGQIDALTDSVVFDLRALTYLDAAGVQMLLRARARAHAAAIDIGVLAPAGPVRRAFNTTGTDAAFTFLSEPPAPDR